MISQKCTVFIGPPCILYESSYQLGKLPDEWKIGRVTAVYKKVIKVINPITDQLV